MEEEIKVDSSRGLIIEKRETDYIMGASPLKRQILQEDWQWVNFLPAHFELQRNGYFDSYGCVSYSHNNAKEVLFKRLYGYDIDFDDRDLVVMSGTQPRRGNSVTKVADTFRKLGVIKDRGDIPATMTESEYYAWKRSEEDTKEANALLEMFECNYEWLPTCNFGGTYSSPEQLMEALKYTPIQASVDGSYDYNENGYIGKLLNWNHEIVIVGGVKDKYWLVYDSESYNGTLLKFAWDYKFGYPISHSITKKKSMKLYKKKGEPAIYFLNPADNKLVPYSDGAISGGEMFKILFGDYKFAPVEKVDKLPYPIADYSLSTVFDRGAVGEV